MKSLLTSSVSCAALFFLAAPASAQESSSSVGSSGDWYVSVFAGGSSLQEVDTNYSGSGYTIDFDTGYVVGATVGRNISQNWRIEGELSHAKHNANAFAFLGGPDAPASEGLDATYLLANVWYDIPTRGKISPYVGGGVGIARIKGDVLFSNGFGFAPSDNTAFTYQLGAGVNIPVGSRFVIDAGYRFKVTSKTHLTDRGGGPDYTNSPIESHSLQLGLRMNF
jgi:opacity protein-like surface antigen